MKMLWKAISCHALLFASMQRDCFYHLKQVLTYMNILSQDMNENSTFVF
jgi:hypothetical protein